MRLRSLRLRSLIPFVIAEWVLSEGAESLRDRVIARAVWSPWDWSCDHSFTSRGSCNCFIINIMQPHGKLLTSTFWLPIWDLRQDWLPFSDIQDSNSSSQMLLTTDRNQNQKSFVMRPQLGGQNVDAKTGCLTLLEVLEIYWNNFSSWIFTKAPENCLAVIIIIIKRQLISRRNMPEDITRERIRPCSTMWQCSTICR